MMMQSIFGGVVTLGVLAAYVGAQVIFNIETNNFDCPVTGGRYCAAASLTSNIIVRCAGYIGDPEDCRNQLYGIPPLSIKDFAPCYQRYRTIGDAACTLNGTVYPVDGEPFPIPTDPIPADPVFPLEVRLATNVTTAAPTESTNESNAVEPPVIIAQVKNASTTSSGLNSFTATITHGPAHPLASAEPAEKTETVLGAGVPNAFVGGIRALAKSNDPSDALPGNAINGTNNPSSATAQNAIIGTGIYSSVKREYIINGTSNSSIARPEGTINGTGGIEKVAPTAALYTGSANMYGVEMCAIWAGMLAVASFILAN